MANFNLSPKELRISRNQQMSLLAVSIAVIAAVMTLFFALKMQAQMTHQSNVITCLRSAKKVIDANREKIDNLQESYDEFNESETLYDEQILNDNAVIVLRALPTTYNRGWTQQAWGSFLKDPDSPSSKRAGHEGATISISGLPEPDNTSGTPLPPAGGAEEGSSGLPGTAIPLQFSMSVSLEEGGEETLINILEDLDNFIQPVKVRSISLTYSDAGDSGNSRLGQAQLELQTYVQPARELQFQSETVSKDNKPGCLTGASPAVQPAGRPAEGEGGQQ